MLTVTLAESSLSGYLMAAGAVLLMMLIMVNVRSRYARRQHDHLPPRERLERVKQTHGMRNDMRDMMVELEELTRRFSAQLDAKSMTLEKLLDRADQTIAKLENLTEQSAAAPPAAPPKEPYRRSRKTAAAQAIDAAAEPPAPPPAPDVLSQRIYQLADAGKSSVQIAKQLDEQVGKVELILALRQ
ncbi:MAG: hypothetical protein GC162_14755 [Planctomycetes bacterium]|nr:hypothetical protein [Planctomycetota bacterium]